MASLPQVCGLLPPPDRNDVLSAIGRTILAIRRRHGISAKDIARSLKQEDGESPHEETILRAEKGANLLSFDLIAQLAFIYRDCAEPIRMILEPAPTAEPTTIEERLARAEQEILTARRELAANGGGE